MQKDELIKEINQELFMRRETWPTIYKQPERFLRVEHQRKYDRLKTVGTIIGALTQAQINKILLGPHTHDVEQGKLF